MSSIFIYAILLICIFFAPIPIFYTFRLKLSHITNIEINMLFVVVCLQSWGIGKRERGQGENKGSWGWYASK